MHGEHLAGHHVELVERAAPPVDGVEGAAALGEDEVLVEFAALDVAGDVVQSGEHRGGCEAPRGGAEHPEPVGLEAVLVAQEGQVVGRDGGPEAGDAADEGRDLVVRRAGQDVLAALVGEPAQRGGDVGHGRGHARSVARGPTLATTSTRPAP